MSETLIAQKYELTKDDLRVIAEVAEATLKDSGRAIALLRGPETLDTLKKWFPNNESWRGLQKLGTEVARGNPMSVTRSSGRPACKFQKHIGRLFVGSKKWPEGIPVGVTDIYAQDRMFEDSYKLDCSTYDFNHDEYETLRFMSLGRHRMSVAESKEDRDRKDEIRSQRAEIEATTTPEERAARAAAKAMMDVMREEQKK